MTEATPGVEEVCSNVGAVIIWLRVRTGCPGNAVPTRDRTSAGTTALMDCDAAGFLLRDRMLGTVLGLSLTTDTLWDTPGGARMGLDTCRTL